MDPTYLGLEVLAWGAPVLLGHLEQARSKWWNVRVDSVEPDRLHTHSRHPVQGGDRGRSQGRVQSFADDA